MPTLDVFGDISGIAKNIVLGSNAAAKTVVPLRGPWVRPLGNMPSGDREPCERPEGCAAAAAHPILLPTSALKYS